MPVLVSDYVNRGLVRLAVHTLPLQSHGDPAIIESRLGACAASRGKFWDFRESMFARQTPTTRDAESWLIQSGAFTDAELPKCADAQVPTVNKVSDVAKKAGVTATPSFFLGTTTDGRLQAKSVKQGIGAGDEWLRRWLKEYVK